MKKTHTAAVLVLGTTIALAAWLVSTKPERTAKPPVEKTWPITAAHLVPGKHTPNLKLYGAVESPDDATLTSVVAADVADVLVREGEQVQKGQLLIQLDDTEVRRLHVQCEAELRQFEAKARAQDTRHAGNLEALPYEEELLSLARTEASRLAALQNKGSVARSDLDSARQAVARQGLLVSSRKQQIAEYEATQEELAAQRVSIQAKCEQAEQDLGRTAVAAPHAGRVTAIHVAPGERVRSGDNLVTVFDSASVRLRAQLPERYLPVLQSEDADSLIAQVIGISGVYPAHLSEVATRVSSTGSIEAIFEFPKTSTKLPGELILGRVFLVELDLPSVLSFSVPSQAVYDGASGERIYAVRDGRLESVPVSRQGNARGADEAGQVLVVAESAHDQLQVMLTRLPNAIDGLKVSVAQVGTKP